MTPVFSKNYRELNLIVVEIQNADNKEHDDNEVYDYGG